MQKCRSTRNCSKFGLNSTWSNVKVTFSKRTPRLPASLSLITFQFKALVISLSDVNVTKFEFFYHQKALGTGLLYCILDEFTLTMFFATSIISYIFCTTFKSIRSMTMPLSVVILPFVSISVWQNSLTKTMSLSSFVSISFVLLENKFKILC